MSKYPIEIIPDADKLFYHVPKALFLANGFNFSDIPPHVFTPIGECLSTNWEKYCPTAEDCLQIRTDKYPEGRTTLTHGVGHFVAKQVREIEFLAVTHHPTKNNQAHTHIEGIPPKKPKPPYNEMRMKLKRIFQWDIEPLMDKQDESLEEEQDI